MARKNKQLVWHYTYSNNIKAIVDSGVLLPPCMTPHALVMELAVKREGLDPNSQEYKADAAMLLFSQREDWEPASYRAVNIEGMVHPLYKLEEYEAFGIDVFRIAVSRKHLYSYTRLKEIVHLPEEMARSLDKTARAIGSNPFDWFGINQPIPMEKWEVVQIYDTETKTWKSLLGEVEETEPQPMAAD